MQTILEIEAAESLANTAAMERKMTGFDPGLDEARAFFSSLGMDILQTRPAKGRWSCAVTTLQDWALVELHCGASSILLAPNGSAMPVLAFQNTSTARFCGCPWQQDRIAAAQARVPFVLLFPANATVSFFFSTKSDPLGSPHSMMFLPAGPDFRARLRACFYSGGTLEPGSRPAFPSGDLRAALRNPLPLNRSPHSNAYRVGTASTKFLLQPDPPTICFAEYLGVSLRTTQYAFTQVTDFPLVAIRRIFRLHVARDLLVQGKMEKVSRAAAHVGLWHLGRFSIDFRTLFGESPVQILNRSKFLHPHRQPPSL